ncbi:hypothetical protein EV426DRAFT_581202 [Tirmania nivea]|nr:hypothetical protein EV426DRAFT_581202 [Tirmania nivea]
MIPQPQQSPPDFMELPEVPYPPGSTQLSINPTAAGTPQNSMASNTPPQSLPSPPFNPPASNSPSCMSTVDCPLQPTSLSLSHTVRPSIDPEPAPPPVTPPIPRSMVAADSMELHLRKLRAEALESEGKDVDHARGVVHAYVTARLREWAAISGQDGESLGVMAMDEDEEEEEEEEEDGGQGYHCVNHYLVMRVGKVKGVRKAQRMKVLTIGKETICDCAGRKRLRPCRRCGPEEDYIDVANEF